MRPHSLFASAVINFGSAFFVLSLFSILKKQPSNAPIYYARRLSQKHTVSFNPNFTLRRFLPSISWIQQAFRVTEDEIFDLRGLDALVLLRFLKFGIRFFVICSFVGLVVLLPVNFDREDGKQGSYHSMDSFTISNVGEGSNRLWVHFTCLWLISLYAMYLLHKEYKRILSIRIRQLRKHRHRPDQFTVLVRDIPFCADHKAYDCCVDPFFSKNYPNAHCSYQMLIDAREIEHLLTQAKTAARKIEDLRKTSYNKNHREPLLLDASHGTAIYERKLEDLRHKLHQQQHESMLKGKELPVAFVTFKSRWGAAVASQTLQHPHTLLWITEMAPEPRDISWRNLTLPFKFFPLYGIGVVLAASLLTVFFAIPVTAVQGIAKYEKLKKWFPPAMAIQLIPGLSSIVTGYLPSAILKGFLYIIPFAMFALAKLSGCISKSKEEIKACSMVFYFLVGNVFFLTLVSGSLLDEIGEYLSHPKSFPTHLARAVSAQSDFFMTYILTDGLSGFSFEVLQPGLLLWDIFKSCTYGRGKEKTPYVYSFPYFRIIPSVSLCVLIGMVYAVVAPLLLPFLIGYFSLGYVVCINQMDDVYVSTYETHGQYWPHIHHYILVAILLMQITMVGLFGLKSKPAASLSTIPLVLLTIMFNEYCKMRFLPAFHQLPIQTAVENDDLDKQSNELEVHSKNAISAYRLPCLRLASMESEAGSTQSSV